MNPKTTIGLVIALLIALIGVWWAESSSNQPAEKAAAGPRALFDPPLADVTEFEFVTAGAAPMKFVMQKDKWRMMAPVEGPTEHYVVNGDVTRVKDLKFSKTYRKNDSERPTDDMAGLQSPQRSAKLTDKSGKSYVVKIGARQTLSSKTYVQKEGDDAIYIVDADLNQEMKHGLNDYRGKRVCEFTPTDAVRLDAAGEHQYVFTSVAGKWTLETPMKARADKTAVGNLVRALSSLSAAAFVDDSPKSLRPYGLDNPRLVLTVSTETKSQKPPPAPPASAPAEPEFDITRQTYKIAFGGSAEDKVFAKLDEPASAAVFQISEANFKQLSVQLDDLRDKAVVEVEPAQAQKIAVTSVTSGGESVELTKSDGQWKITSGLQPGETAKAELAAVDDLLKALKDLKAMGFETAETPAQGFAKPRGVIEVTREGRIEPMRITIGGQTVSKTGAYVRNDREGFVAVVKADAVNALVVRPIEFLGRDMTKFNSEMASRIDLGFPKYTVTAQKEGRQWQLTSPVQGAAESGNVGALLNDLATLRGRRVVGRAKDAKTFGLERPTVKVTVTVDNPPIVKPVPVTQPSSAPAAPEMIPQPPSTYAVNLTRLGDKSYAMLAGGNVICEIDGKVVDDALAELLDTRVAPVEAAQAKHLAYEGAEKFALDKAGDAWKLAGEPTFSVDPAKVTEVFNALGAVRAKEFTRYTGAKPADYGLTSPMLSLSAQTEDGKSLKLTISSQGPDKGGRYASLSEKPDRVFVLRQEDVDKLTKKLSDFQKAG